MAHAAGEPQSSRPKWMGSMGIDPNGRGNSRRWIITEHKPSLRRFGADYIDICWMRHSDPDCDLDRTLAQTLFTRKIGFHLT